MWKDRWFWMHLRLKIKFWILDHTPVFCADCHVLGWEKDMTYEKPFTGHDVPLCETCHQKWFGDK